jgi:hypothetical protein
MFHSAKCEVVAYRDFEGRAAATIATEDDAALEAVSIS